MDSLPPEHILCSLAWHRYLSGVNSSIASLARSQMGQGWHESIGPLGAWRSPKTPSANGSTMFKGSEERSKL
jgi:hypothetical protein